jgi:hypothetical protein
MSFNSLKMEKLLNILLGISWSLLIFGTIFVFTVTIIAYPFSVTLISTFSIFFVSSILVLFLESLKLQIKQEKLFMELLNELKGRNFDK